jgi:GntR family transcriptional regulator, transcriptional repressor for pyruvate dehydrogenase complex
MDFRPIKNSKVYEKVIEQIKDLIYEGKIRRGDRLPSERKLKEQLNVSRASIREAFSALEMMGLIESRPGEGTFIKGTPDKHLLEPLSLVLLLEEDISEELIELRRVLEVDSVRLAAERATEAELAEMEGYINDLAASSGFEEQSVQADRMFHYSIARASHNKVLYYTMISISEVMDFHIKSVRTRLVSKKETMDEFLRQHQKIFDTIKAQDSSRAMQAMKEHLNYVEGLIKKEIEG